MNLIHADTLMDVQLEHENTIKNIRTTPAELFRLYYDNQKHQISCNVIDDNGAYIEVDNLARHDDFETVTFYRIFFAVPLFFTDEDIISVTHDIVLDGNCELKTKDGTVKVKDLEVDMFVKTIFNTVQIEQIQTINNTKPAYEFTLKDESDWFTLNSWPALLIHA